jgi:hypothetical protein
MERSPFPIRQLENQVGDRSPARRCRRGLGAVPRAPSGLPRRGSMAADERSIRSAAGGPARLNVLRYEEVGSQAWHGVTLGKRLGVLCSTRGPRRTNLRASRCEVTAAQGRRCDSVLRSGYACSSSHMQ